MVPNIAAKIMIRGMDEGWFTGRTLDQYIDDADEADSEDLREYINARPIINGKDKAEQIGLIAVKFEAALKAAGA
jgi:putative chitinase